MGTVEHIHAPKSALDVIGALEDAGYEAWIVGGFVRDALLGRASYDVDIATDAHWQDVQRICESAGMRTYETGVKHGTLTVVPVSTVEGSGNPADSTEWDISKSSQDVSGTSATARPEMPSQTGIEVTTYRTDGAYADARHPEHVEFIRSIEEDLRRRDFTMNAMAWHPERGLLDPYRGREDIERGIIRVVGDPERRFSEDALRILRACRFASQLGFTIGDEDYRAMMENKFRLASVSTERITHELDALLLGEWVHDALMRCVGVLSFVLPELVAMDGCEQVTRWHCYDVLEHTAYTVQFTPPERLVRWAALVHDMGKPAAAFFGPDGTEHFYGHAKLSARIARGIGERMLMSQAFRSDLETLVLRHDDLIDPTPRAVRRALARLDGRVDLFRALLALKRADTLAHSEEGAAHVTVIDQLEEVLADVLAGDEAFQLRDLAVNGADVMALGVAQGPAVGRLLHAALDAVIDGRVPNRRNALIELLKSLDAEAGNP